MVTAPGACRRASSSRPLMTTWRFGCWRAIRSDLRGRPPYHPALMVKLLIYGYCTGRMSSRKLEQATYDDVAFRVLACNQIGLARAATVPSGIDGQAADLWLLHRAHVVAQARAGHL